MSGGLGMLRAACGSLPVSPLLDRSAQSFTFTERSGGSFSTVGSLAERPHSFTVGERPQAAMLLVGGGGGGLGERAQPFGLQQQQPLPQPPPQQQHGSADSASRPSAFAFAVPAVQQLAPPQESLGARALGVERSAASFPVLERPMGLLDGLGVVERGSQTQRSFTLGQRPQLQMGLWFEGQGGAGVAAGGGPQGVVSNPGGSLADGGLLYYLPQQQQQQALPPQFLQQQLLQQQQHQQQQREQQYQQQSQSSLGQLW
jgi:hypothetical protein